MWSLPKTIIVLLFGVGKRDSFHQFHKIEDWLAQTLNLIGGNLVVQLYKLEPSVFSLAAPRAIQMLESRSRSLRLLSFG